MYYTVWYKLSSSFFWHKLKHVKGDLLPTDMPEKMRVFILKDESRVEVPLVGTSFRFSRERWVSILKKMEEEAGQKLPLKND